MKTKTLFNIACASGIVLAIGLISYSIARNNENSGVAGVILFIASPILKSLGD
jgi:hypothetical protein